MKHQSAKKINAQSRAIDREIAREEGLITIYRGRFSIHKSRAEKRRGRSKDRQNAIRESSE